MKQIGQLLRSKREEQGLSLKDVEQALSIRVKYLSALEEENYRVIPGEVYIKGFLRNYANYLGLNAEDMIRLYKEATVLPVEIQTEVKEEEISPPNMSIGSGFKYVVWALGMLLMAGAIYYYYVSLPRQAEPGVPAPPPISTTVPAPSGQIPPQNTVSPTGQGVKLLAKVTNECWVRISADGKEVFRGVLRAGENKSWDAKNEIEITLGNAGGVELTVNGKRQGPLGKTGEVAKKTYTAQ